MEFALSSMKTWLSHDFHLNDCACILCLYTTAAVWPDSTICRSREARCRADGYGLVAWPEYSEAMLECEAFPIYILCTSSLKAWSVILSVRRAWDQQKRCVSSVHTYS